jgi:hypothetical protein
MSNDLRSEPAESLPRRRLWLWALLGVVTGVVAVIVVLNIWNSRLRLTAEKLAAAQAAWERTGPPSYDLRLEVSGSSTAVYDLEVRNRKLVAARVNGQPFERPEKAHPWTVPGLFDVVLRQDLENDAKPGSLPAYTQVEFDSIDGHPIRYLRTSGQHRVQIETKLTVIP